MFASACEFCKGYGFFVATSYSDHPYSDGSAREYHDEHIPCPECDGEALIECDEPFCHLCNDEIVEGETMAEDSGFVVHGTCLPRVEQEAPRWEAPEDYQ